MAINFACADSLWAEVSRMNIMVKSAAYVYLSLRPSPGFARPSYGREVQDKSLLLGTPGTLCMHGLSIPLPIRPQYLRI